MFVPTFEAAGRPGFCVFCLRHRDEAERSREPHRKHASWLGGEVFLGPSCSYGLAHEFWPESVAKAKPEKKVDKKLCNRCGLHPKNPASASNGCAHEYTETNDG
jgi:hypothetical protein